MSKVKIFTGIMVLFLLGVATGSLMTNIYLKTDFMTCTKCIYAEKF